MNCPRPSTRVDDLMSLRILFIFSRFDGVASRYPRGKDGVMKFLRFDDLR